MEIRLPALAEGADSGTVVNLLVSEGDRVAKGQTILELENQKAVAPIPSPASGVVARIHVKRGDSITVGQVLVTLSETGGSAQEAAPSARPEPAAGKPVPPRPVEAGGYRYASASGAPPPASPSVRKLARELGVDLTRVRGSDRGGRILLEDVRAYVQALQAAPSVSGESHALPERIDFSRWGPVRRAPFSPLRRAVAQAMEDSWTTIPHVTQFDEADATEILQMVGKYGPQYEKKGARLTLTVLILKAIVQVLKKHPIFNSSLDEAAGEIVFKEYVHLGIAVDTEAGLIVPVLRDADQKGMFQLSKELDELAQRTRQRKVSADELRGGTFTLSNQGGVGGMHFTPIIHKPEVAVLGVGRAVLKPVIRQEGQPPQPRRMLPLALSYDHRVIDGAQAARFIRDLVDVLEGFPESEVAG